MIHDQELSLASVQESKFSVIKQIGNLQNTSSKSAVFKQFGTPMYLSDEMINYLSKSPPMKYLCKVRNDSKLSFVNSHSVPTETMTYSYSYKLTSRKRS